MVAHCCVFIRCHSNGCQHMPPSLRLLVPSSLHQLPSFSLPSFSRSPATRLSNRGRLCSSRPLPEAPLWCYLFRFGGAQHFHSSPSAGSLSRTEYSNVSFVISRRRLCLVASRCIFPFFRSRCCLAPWSLMPLLHSGRVRLLFLHVCPLGVSRTTLSWVGRFGGFRHHGRLLVPFCDSSALPVMGCIFWIHIALAA
jgi:hypothetical protein